MKYKILKKSIRINKYNTDTENDTFNINLSLMSYKNELLNYNVTVYHPYDNLYSNIKESILIFKGTDEYENALKLMDSESENISNNLSIEYNSINDITDIKYFNIHLYEDITDRDYSKGYITRYIAKFLNHNVLTDISISDYNDIINKNENTHFEAYDATSINWKLTGGKDEVFKANNNELNKLKNKFGDFNEFYGLIGSDNGPFYLTIYDEIPNLYTIGGELIYEDTLRNYSGYYHYIKGKLWSGKFDEMGPNRLLMEGVAEEVSSDIQDDIGDIVNDVNNLVDLINAELGKYPKVLDDFKTQINGYADDFKKDIQASIDEFLDGTDLKDIFNQSMQDMSDMISNPDSKEAIETRYENEANKKTAGKNADGKGPKMPKIKIPNVHIGRKPHGEGESHNYEVGF